MSPSLSSPTRRNVLAALGVGTLGLFGLSSLAANDVYTRYGGGSTPPLTPHSRLDADEFYTFVDEMAEVYGRYGVFGMSVPLDADFVGAWTDGFVRPFDSDAFDGSFRANAAVVSYRLASDELVHLVWVAGRVDGATYNPDPFDLLHSPMRLTYLDVRVDLQDGAIESVSFPQRDGGGWTLSFDRYSLRYAPATTTDDEQISTSKTTNPTLRGARTEAGSDGATHVEWSGYGPAAFAVASAFATSAALSALDTEWDWGYGIGTEGPV